MKIYSADICIDCRNLKYLLETRGLTQELCDITANTANLREFLHLRDTHPAFDLCRERGGIGIPCFVQGDRLTLDVDEALSWIGQAPVRPEEIREHRS